VSLETTVFPCTVTLRFDFRLIVGKIFTDLETIVFSLIIRSGLTLETRVTFFNPILKKHVDRIVGIQRKVTTEINSSQISISYVKLCPN
jgi:hypothetical protein